MVASATVLVGGPMSRGEKEALLSAAMEAGMSPGKAGGGSGSKAAAQEQAQSGWGGAITFTAFFCGAVTTLCIVWLAGGNTRWQGAVPAPLFQRPQQGGASRELARPQRGGSQPSAAGQRGSAASSSSYDDEEEEGGEGPAAAAAAGAAATQKAAPTSPSPSPPAAPPPWKARMPWEPFLTAEEVERGLSYYGTGNRLELVTAKLLAGKPIVAYTLGGSVTKGSGSSKPEAMYASRFFEFLNATFPHKDHVFVNRGVGATNSGIFSACAEQMVPKGVDLVVIEFTINEIFDAPYTDPQRKGYEQLVRKMLKLPGPPAVILVHHYAWWRAVGDGVTKGLFYYPQAEAQLTVLSQYYNIPSISLRSAVYQLMRVGIKGFRADAVTNQKDQVSTVGEKIPSADRDILEEYFYYDRTHPNDRGHQVLAELLAGLIFKAAEELEDAKVPDTTGWAEERKDKQLAELPPPMIPGNYDSPTTLCAMQEDFKPMVKDWEGFEYKAERPNEPTFVGQKWGWTGTEPGDWAELVFDSRENPDADEVSDAPAMVYLSHLKSYEGMGTADVECISGCDCKDGVLDGTWDQQATLMQIYYFKVSQHPKCRVRVTVKQKAGKVPQKGHKVTLMAVMVSHFPLRLSVTDEQYELVASQVKGN